jgi:hypothetical protein
LLLTPLSLDLSVDLTLKSDTMASAIPIAYWPLR